MSRLPEGVTPEQFVTTWQAGSFLHKVAKQLGMESAAASRYASYLRSKGVPLKKFKSNIEGTPDFEFLARLAREAA